MADDNNIESICEEIEGPDPADNDQRRLSRSYSNYSDDFEPSVLTEGPAFQEEGEGDFPEEEEDFSGEFEEESTLEESVTQDYSSDFETLTRNTKSMKRDEEEQSTARTAPSMAYSDDFESGVMTSSARQSSEQYTMDFESPSRTSFSRTESVESATFGENSYMENFESGSTLSSSQTESIQSVIPSARRSTVYSSEEDYSVSVTETRERTVSSSDTETSQDGSYSYSSSLAQTASYSSEEVMSADQLEMQLAFIQRKLTLLKTGRPAIKPRRKQETDVSRHLARYCDRKMKLLNTKKHLAAPAVELPPARAVNPGAVQDHEVIDTYGISTQRVNRLKMGNTLDRLRQAAKTKIHEPHKCGDCRRNIDALRQQKFLKDKLAIASANLVHEKLQRQLDPLSDPVGLMAEGLQSLPTLQTDPQIILHHLFQSMDSKGNLGTSFEHSNVKCVRFDKKDENLPTGSNTKWPTLYRQMLDKLEKDDVLKSYDTGDTESFWKQYFLPLQSCPWYPTK